MLSRHRITSLLHASLLVAAVAVPLAASPAVGDKAPDFALHSVRGSEVHLSQVTAKGPVVLVVLRGYPGYQCPFCNRQVQDFLRSSAEFVQAGASVILVYPGPAQDLDVKAGEFLRDKTLPGNFDLLLDPGYVFTNLYGLRWDAPSETAYPSTFLIDQHGVVFFAKSSKSHGGRTSAAEILEVLPKPKRAQ